MAGRPSTKVKEETIATEEVVADNNKEDIMAILKQMQKEMAELKSENENLKKSKPQTNADFTQDAEIEVMSLFSGTMTLYTEGFGNGTPYKFEDGYGSIIDIPLGDLKLIVKNNNKLAKSGAFYILNDDVVSMVRLKKIYERLIDVDSMENISKLSDDNIISLYKSATEPQQELILNYFASKLVRNESVSRNLIFLLEEESGKKLTVLE